VQVVRCECLVNTDKDAVVGLFTVREGGTERRLLLGVTGQVVCYFEQSVGPWHPREMVRCVLDAFRNEIPFQTVHTVRGPAQVLESPIWTALVAKRQQGGAASDDDLKPLLVDGWDNVR